MVDLVHSALGRRHALEHLEAAAADARLVRGEPDIDVDRSRVRVDSCEEKGEKKLPMSKKTWSAPPFETRGQIALGLWHV